MKRYLFLLLILSVNAVYAEHPRVEDVRMQKWLYLVEQAQLSPAEKTAVEPIFMDYEATKWKLHKQSHQIFREKKDEEKVIEKNYEQLNNQFVNLEVEKAALLQKYHHQLKQQLSAQKIFQYFAADKRFKRELIQKLKASKATKSK